MSLLSFFARHPRADLSAFIDGQLSRERRVAVETHLARCATCQSELEGLTETRAALSALPQTPAPRSFSLTPNQLAGPAKPTPRRTEPAPAFFGMRIASAGLAVALALVFVADLGDGGNSSSGGDDDDAALNMTTVAEDAAGDGAFSQGGDDSADSDGGEATTEKDEGTSIPLASGVTPPDAPEDGQTPDEGDGGASAGIAQPTPTAVDGGPLPGADRGLDTSTPPEAAAVVPTGTESMSLQYDDMGTQQERTSQELAEDASTGDNDDGLSAIQIAEIVLAVTLAAAVTGGFLLPLALRRTR